MKKLLLVIVVFAFAGMMLAQGQAGVDTLGAHLLNGRGCAGCHVPHNGARGNGLTTTDLTTGDVALWGGDLTPVYGKTFLFGDKGGFPAVMPTDLSGDSHGTMTFAKADPRVGGLLMCLSCHDGNNATNAMMKNKVWETLPAGAYGGTNIPTLLGKDGNTPGDYKNDHPVGETATLTNMCLAYPTGDCTIDSNGKMTILPTDAFYLNYGFTVAPGAYYAVSAGVQSTTGTAIVVCTTCHDQHVMTVYNGTSTMTDKKIHTTYFGIKGWYDPSTGGNNTAQFCRQCHYGRHSNEYNGVTNISTN